MCGRFALVTTYPKIKAQFQLKELPHLSRRYNIAPTQDVLFVMSLPDGKRHAEMLRWGLIPFFAKNRNSMPLIINARAETLAEKPAFRQAFKRKRGLVAMSGFYEWREEHHARQPFYITQKQRRLLAVAALWDTWQSPENEVIHSCCLVTTEGNPLVHAIHARMPVILNDREQEIWMDNTHFDSSLLMSILHPYNGADLTVWPVTPKMNNWRFNNSDAIVPVK